MAKAGRKRKHDAKRYSSGRAAQENPMTTAIEARARLFNLSPDRAKRQESATAIGRAYDNRGDNGARMLSRDQFDALQEWMDAKRKHSIALSSPRHRSASDYSGRAGFDPSDGTDETYIRFCDSAKARHDLLRHAILQSGPMGHFAVQVWCEQDREDYKLIGDLRLAANQIARALRGK